MDGGKIHALPARDPVSGGKLIITELEGADTGIMIRGRFEMPRFANLSPDQSRYLETFLRCRGMLNSVERELGISYPTARARLDAVLRALDLHGVRDDLPTMAPESAVSDSSLEEQAPEPFEESEPPYDETSWETPEDESTGFFEPIAEDPIVEPEEPRRSRHEILTLLERGEITPEEAKKELGVAK